MRAPDEASAVASSIVMIARRAITAVGNLVTVCLLLGADLLCTLIRLFVYSVVSLVDGCTGSGHGTARQKVAWHPQRWATVPVLARAPHDSAAGYGGELDVSKTLAASKFPISPEALVERAKAVLAAEFGTLAGADPDSLLADDFQFVAPVVGPLGKEEFIAAFGSFKVKEAFPDLCDHSWFQVDPLEPNRVWFISRATATHTGALNFGMTIAPTFAKVESPPQAQSMLFDASGKVYTLTVGYCMDKRIGNTEGLGGVFALLKAIGKPLPVPEAQRLYTPSLRYEAFERIAKAGEALGYGPGTTRTAIPVAAAPSALPEASIHSTPRPSLVQSEMM